MCPCWGPGRERGCGGAWLRPRCRLARRRVGARNRAREGPLEAELTTRALQGSFARVAAGGNLGSSPRLHTTIQVPFPPADSISPGPGALPLSPRAKLPNPATIQQYPTLARRKLELCHDSSIFLLSSPGSASLGVDRVEACMEFHGGRLTSVLVQPFSRADLPGTPSRDDRANGQFMSPGSNARAFRCTAHIRQTASRLGAKVHEPALGEHNCKRRAIPLRTNPWCLPVCLLLPDSAARRS
jgi:hypothetical protein